MTLSVNYEKNHQVIFFNFQIKIIKYLTFYLPELLHSLHHQLTFCIDPFFHGPEPGAKMQSTDKRQKMC